MQPTNKKLLNTSTTTSTYIIESEREMVCQGPIDLPEDVTNTRGNTD